MNDESQTSRDGEAGDPRTSFPDSVELAKLLRESFSRGTFLTTAQELMFAAGRNEEFRGELLRTIVRLHKDGTIDVLREIGRFLKEGEKNPLPDFWAWMHLFRTLFSDLPCPLESICRLFAALDERWKRDMASGMWWDYLTDRFRRSSDSAEEMLRLAEREKSFSPGVRRAYAAGLAVDPALWLTRAINSMEQPGALAKPYFNAIVLALSEVDFRVLDTSLTFRFWEVFTRVVNMDDPCFDWFAAYLSVHEMRLKGFRTDESGIAIRCILGRGDAAVLERMLIVLAAGWRATDEQERQWSLDALANFDPQKPAPIAALDRFVFMLLREGFTKTAVDVISSHLIRRNAELTDLPRTVGEFRRTQQSQLVATAAAWLSSGNRILEKAASELLPFEIGKDSVPPVDASRLKIETEALLPFAAKLIGHLFDRPKTLFEFLFPCLDRMGSEERKSLRPVLLDPVFLCYHKQAREYLDSKGCTIGLDTASFLRGVLDEAEKDMLVLSKSGPFPELRPSLREQIETDRLREQDNERIMLQTQRDSVLDMLAHQISLLHGNGWILYQPGVDGTLVRSSGELQRLSVSVALPRLPNAMGLEFNWRLAELKRGNWNIDPVEELGE